MTQKQTKIVGKTLFGETRVYTFNIMNAERGLEVFHSTVSGLMEMTRDMVEIVPSLAKIVENYGDGTKDNQIDVTPELLEVVRIVPKILTWEKITFLACEILSGCKVEIDGEIYDTPENGIGEYTVGDPLELYTALVYGICANYPKYVAGITAKDDQKKDSTPKSIMKTTKPVKIRKRK